MAGPENSSLTWPCHLEIGSRLLLAGPVSSMGRILLSGSRGIS